MAGKGEKVPTTSADTPGTSRDENQPSQPMKKGRKPRKPIPSITTSVVPVPEHNPDTKEIEAYLRENPGTSKMSAVNRTEYCGLPVKPCNTIIRGKDPISPYVDIQSFPLKELVDKGLKVLRIDDINALQRCAWPQIVRGRNCVLVGGPNKNQGKTLAYLVPLAAKVLNDAELFKRGTGQGPVAIIMCGSSVAAKKIEVQLRLLVGNELVIYRGAQSDVDFARNMSKNPEFLICRPDFVSFLSMQFPHLLGFDRLRYVVIDDCHILEEEFFGAAQGVYRIISHQVEKVSPRKWPLQFILCGQLWNQTMRAVFGPKQPFNDPVLIISSYMQALVYGRVRLGARLVGTNQKSDEVGDIIEDSLRNHRHVVVACQDRETAHELGCYLLSTRNITSTTFESEEKEIMTDAIRRVRSAWNHRSMSQPTVIIAGDSDLYDLQLVGVTTLIHYDLPLGKLDAFGERHMCMWDGFPDVPCTKPIVELRSHVILTKEEDELSKVVSQLKAANAEIPHELAILTTEMKERGFTSAALCDGIKMYGQCNAPDKVQCDRTRRHYFTRKSLLATASVPQFRAGRVIVKIVRCLDLNLYVGVVLEFYTIRNGKKFQSTDYTTVMAKRRQDLGELYKNESNRKPVAEPVVGEVYCIHVDSEEIEYKGFTRAMFYQTINEQDENGRCIRYRFLCIDIGVFAIKHPDDVYNLPVEYIQMHPLTVNIIIADIKPIGEEDEFRRNKRGMGGNAKDLLQDRVVTAKVCLAIENTIWVKTMIELQMHNGEWIFCQNARVQFLRNLKVAEDNPGHLPALYELCKNQGFDVSEYLAEEDFGRDFHLIDDPYQWAFLPMPDEDATKMTTVICSFAICPYRIFAIRSDFCDQLEKLEKELHQEIESLIHDKHPDYATKFKARYEWGLCVAALVDGEGWARAIITHVWDLENRLVDVFWVDQGHTSIQLPLKNIFPIPKKFVQRLPFQVICLKLYHIQPSLTIGKFGPVRAWSKSAKAFVANTVIREDGLGLRCDVLPVRNLTTCKRPNDPVCYYYDCYLIGIDMYTGELGCCLESNALAEFMPGGFESWKAARTKLLQSFNKTVDKELGKCNDENELPHDDALEKWDVNLGESNAFVAQMFNDMGVPTNVLPEPGSSKVGSNNVISPPAKSKTGPIPSTSKGHSKKATVKTIGKENVSNKKYPEVRWSQTRTHILLKVCLADVTTYKLNIQGDKRTMTFETTDAMYGFTLKSFARLKQLYAKNQNLGGQSLILYFKKISPGHWPRLLLDDIKPHWLKSDLDYLMLDSDSDDGEFMDGEPNLTKSFKKMSLDQSNQEEVEELGMNDLLEADDLIHEKKARDNDSSDDEEINRLLT